MGRPPADEEPVATATSISTRTQVLNYVEEIEPARVARSVSFFIGDEDCPVDDTSSAVASSSGLRDGPAGVDSKTSQFVGRTRRAWDFSLGAVEGRTSDRNKVAGRWTNHPFGAFRRTVESWFPLLRSRRSRRQDAGAVLPKSQISWGVLHQIPTPSAVARGVHQKYACTRMQLEGEVIEWAHSEAQRNNPLPDTPGASGAAAGNSPTEGQAPHFLKRNSAGRPKIKAFRLKCARDEGLLTKYCSSVCRWVAFGGTCARITCGKKRMLTSLEP